MVDVVRERKFEEAYAALLIAQGSHPKRFSDTLGHRSITAALDRYGICSRNRRSASRKGFDAARESARTMAEATLVPPGRDPSVVGVNAAGTERGG